MKLLTLSTVFSLFLVNNVYATEYECLVSKLSKGRVTEYKTIDRFEVGARTHEFGRFVKSLNNVRLRITAWSNDVLSIRLSEGLDSFVPDAVFADITTSVQNRPLEIRVPVNEDMIALYCHALD